MNQLFQQLNQSLKKSNPMAQFLKKKYNECMMAANPAAYIQNMIQENPQVRTAFELAQQNGGNMQQLFYKLAAAKGVDPNSILDMLK